MNGIITDSTVRDPLTGVDHLEDLTIDDIFPQKEADRYKIAMFRAITDYEHQWCAYSIRGIDFVALIEFVKDWECFSVHEAQITELSTEHIENLRLRLYAMSGQYHKLFKNNRNGTK